MSEDKSSVGDAAGQVGDSVSDQDMGDQQAQSVDVDGLKKSRDKLLSEVKKLKKLAQDQAQMVEQSHAEKLQAEGKKDELISNYQKQLNELQKKNREIYGNFALSNLKTQLASEAVKYGCVDVDALIALSDLSNVEVDADTYKADPEVVKAMVEDMKVKKGYLFNKQAPKFDTSMPGQKEFKVSSDLDLSKMTSKELLEMAHKLQGKLKGG